MRRLLATAVLLVLAAAPAAAAVYDPEDVLPAAEEARLVAALAPLPPHFDVVLRARIHGRPRDEARRAYAQHGLGPRGALVLVAITDRKVGMHVGADYTRRGLSNAGVDGLITTHFVPAARRNDISAAAEAVLGGLHAWDRANARTPPEVRAARQAAAPPPPRRENRVTSFFRSVALAIADFVMRIVAIVALLGGIYLWFVRGWGRGWVWGSSHHHRDCESTDYRADDDRSYASSGSGSPPSDSSSSSNSSSGGSSGEGSW